MNCMLLVTTIALNPNPNDNTKAITPRTWEFDRYETEKDCKNANLHRKDLDKWVDFSDEQDKKKSKSECVCF